MKKKFFIIFIIFCPLILVLFLIFQIITHKDLSLFPSNSFKSFPYTDRDDVVKTGKSTVEYFTDKNNKIILTYTLKEGAYYPYLGLRIESKNLFNISDYDLIKIKIKSLKAERLKLYIQMPVDINIKHKMKLPYLFLQKEIPLWKKKDQYILRIKDFYIPEWWQQLNNLSEKESMEMIDLSRINNFEIENGEPFPVNVTDTITLDSITLSKDYTLMIVYFIIILFSYYSIFIIFVLIKLYKKKIIKNMKKIIIPYKYLELENYMDEEVRKFMRYMMDNYKKPDLTIEIVSIQSGVSLYKISVILKEKFNLTFPQYLNAIRLVESKRLLKDTTDSITDIAFKIGYNNLSYFNFVFKNMESISPQKYRNKFKSPKN